jgi:hypothetical protein
LALEPSSLPQRRRRRWRGRGDGDILCLSQFVTVLAPRSFPRAPVSQLFLRGASVKAKRVLPPALFFLDGQRRLLGVVSGAMVPDTYSSAEQSSGGSGVAGHGSGSSGSHSKSACVLRFLGSLSFSGGWIWGEDPTAAADTGRRAQPGLYRGGTRVWARGRTTGGASERRGEHPRLPAKKGGSHGRAPSSRLPVRLHQRGRERGIVLSADMRAPGGGERKKRERLGQLGLR